MNNSDSSLLGDTQLATPCSANDASLLPSQLIRQMINAGLVSASTRITEDQIQPASLDLRLGDTGYLVQASFLPGVETPVRDKIGSYAIQEIDLTHGALLQKGSVYIVKVLEELNLPDDIYGMANPKSSIGRLNVFTRMIADFSTEFDQIREGYRGALYAEVAPLAFNIVARLGSRLSQVRFKPMRPICDDGRSAKQLSRQQARSIQSGVEENRRYRGGVPVTVDAQGDRTGGVIGYKAKRNTPVVDVDKRDYYRPDDYWDTIHTSRNRELILNPEEFYILASRESIIIPPDYAAEMVAYDPLVGEFRVHYAGFFDPAFGHEAGGGNGTTRAVLEVRSHDVPFIVQDGQIVGRLVYEPLVALPDKLYSARIGSAYQKQGLTLSKQFKSL